MIIEKTRRHIQPRKGWNIGKIAILCHPYRVNHNCIAQQGRNQISLWKQEIASEKALAMTATMHFDGTLHVVIASEAKQSFTHKKRHLLKGVCEKTYKKRSFVTL